MSSNKSSSLSKKRKNEVTNTKPTTEISSSINNEKQQINKKLKSTTIQKTTPTKTTTTTTTTISNSDNKINIKEINNILSSNNNNNKHIGSNSISTAESWDGITPIENLTIGQLITSLNGRQHQLRVIVAEYMNSLNRLTGFTEKTPYLLNWVLDNLSKSFINWKQPEKAEQLIQKGIEPLFFEERYWLLLENLVNKQLSLLSLQQQQQELQAGESITTATTSSSSSKLSNEYLQFIFEIILNSTRNIDKSFNLFEYTTNTIANTTTSSKKKKNINIPYQITTSPPPPIKLLEFSKRISIQLIKIYSSDDLMKEIPLLLESLIPLFIRYLRRLDNKSNEIINSILDLFQTLFQYLLIQTKLGINFKSIFTTILSTLLPHILTLQNALENINSSASSTSNLIETIDDLLKWTLYHPESHWDSYPYILFSDWLKKIVKTPQQPTETKDKSKKKEKAIETQPTSQVDAQIYQPQLILDRLSQLINSSSFSGDISTCCCFNEKEDTISSIVVNSLYKFLIYFIEQYESFGYRHFKDITQWYDSGTHKDEKFIEFAYFRKLFTLINSNSNLLKSNPIYYESISKLLNQVSILNIFHISNRYQVDYLSNVVGLSYYSFLTIQNNDETTINGIYKCLTSLVKISNTLIGNKLKDVIMPHIWSSSSSDSNTYSNGRCEFLKSTFDSYFEIRQIDTLLTMLFQSIISVRSFGNDYKYCTINQEFLQHISKLFSNLPFGQVPIIWNLFLEEWQGYYITQLNEASNSSVDEDSFLDPMFSNRLENFIRLWSKFFDSITISSFVYKMILQLLPNTYQSIVDPILNEIYKSTSSCQKPISSLTKKSKKSKNEEKEIASSTKTTTVNQDNIVNLLRLYSSFLQVHSFIHRQTIVNSDSENGKNEYGYHPQQFYYYQLCEKELEFSKIIEYLVSTNSNKIIKSKLLIQRVQQLHSILSSVSITNYKRNSKNNNDKINPSNNNEEAKIKYISSFLNQQYSPRDIEFELIDIVYYLLNNFINQVNNNSLFNQLNRHDELLIQSKLLIDNISTWSEYSTIENIQNILKFIISPPIEIGDITKISTITTTTTSSIYNEFQKLLSNPLFFELKVFQNNFPIVLCQMERDIITKELIKSNKLFDKVMEIFNDIQEKLINSGSLTPSNTSYAEIIIEIQDCFSKKLSIKDFNLTDHSKWERLTWLVSLAQSFHPLYIPIDLIGPLVLSSIVINHIGIILLKQLKLEDGNDGDADGNHDGDDNGDHFDYIYKLILSSRRFIKFCFEKDQSRLVQIIPMNIWIDLIFSSRMFESIDTKYPILFTSLEIQHHYNNELWKHSPMELKKLADKIMNKNKSTNKSSFTLISGYDDIITIKPYLIAGILKSISTTIGVASVDSSNLLPPDLQSIIKSVEPDIKLFYDKMFEHCSTNTTFENISPFFNQYQAEFSLLVYHLWYQLYFYDDNENNNNNGESLSKLLITVSFLGVFISGLSNSNVSKYSLILQNSIISLLDLFSRWYSKLPSNNSILMIDSLHALSLLSKMLSLYPDDSKLHKSISTSIIQFFQLNNQLGYLLNSITTTIIDSASSNSNCSTSIQLQSFNLLGYFITSIIGTKRISLLKNPVKLVTAIVCIINQTNGNENLIVNGINLLCKLMSINTIDLQGDCIPIILSIMSSFSSPFIYSTPTRTISSFNTEIISNCPMSLFIKDSNFGNNNISPIILNSIYKLLYIILKFRNNQLSRYISSFVSALRFLLYSVSNETNRLLVNNEKSIKKVARLLEVFSMNKNIDLYFQYLIIDYVQLVRYSTTAISNTTNNNNNNNSNKKQYVGPQYHLSTEMRNLLLPGIFSLVEKSNSNSNKELFQALEDTGKGIFQNIISQYQSYKYTGK